MNPCTPGAAQAAATVGLLRLVTWFVLLPRRR